MTLTKALYHTYCTIRTQKLPGTKNNVKNAYPYGVAISEADIPTRSHYASRKVRRNWRFDILTLLIGTCT